MIIAHRWCSLGNLALERLNHFLLLSPDELALGEVLLEFFELYLHDAVLLQLLLVLLRQPLVVRSLSLQVPHPLEVARQAHLLAVQAFLLLGEVVEGTVLPLPGVLTRPPQGVRVRVVGFYRPLGVRTVQLRLLFL